MGKSDGETPDWERKRENDEEGRPRSYPLGKHYTGKMKWHTGTETSGGALGSLVHSLLLRRSEAFFSPLHIPRVVKSLEGLSFPFHRREKQIGTEEKARSLLTATCARANRIEKKISIVRREPCAAAKSTLLHVSLPIVMLAFMLDSTPSPY